jgi:multidrug efflux pump subunit AcrB
MLGRRSDLPDVFASKASSIWSAELGRRKRSARVEYGRTMQVILAMPWLILLLILPLGALGYVSFGHVPSGVMPTIDEGGFVIDYVGPPGTSLSEMDRLLKQVEAILHDTPEVFSYSRRTGFALGEDLSEANTGDFFVRLRPFPPGSLSRFPNPLSAASAPAPSKVMSVARCSSN